MRVDKENKGGGNDGNDSGGQGDIHISSELQFETPFDLLFENLLPMTIQGCLELLVSLTVDAINSYIAWDFSLVQGRVDMDIGFSMEYINPSGQRTGNFCTCLSGNYKLIWDNSYSTFFKKVLRFKVDCIPPVVEPGLSSDQVDE
ncbi:hypothetical protein FXO38_06750 [Capsicum annuum]|nr:hypothetical protein FXO37_14985 [Capsicum annuum]KAF3671131.1 hypothetical protein FXO38_06750 [Capsicum annuum]